MATKKANTGKLRREGNKIVSGSAKNPITVATIDVFNQAVHMISTNMYDEHMIRNFYPEYNITRKEA